MSIKISVIRLDLFPEHHIPPEDVSHRARWLSVTVRYSMFFIPDLSLIRTIKFHAFTCIFVFFASLRAPWAVCILGLVGFQIAHRR